MELVQQSVLVWIECNPHHSCLREMGGGDEDWRRPPIGRHPGLLQPRYFDSSLSYGWMGLLNTDGVNIRLELEDLDAGGRTRISDMLMEAEVTNVYVFLAVKTPASSA